MKASLWLALLLLLVGAVMTYRGLTATERRTIVDIGRFNASVQQREWNPVTTLLGLATLAGGAAVAYRSTRPDKR